MHISLPLSIAQMLREVDAEPTPAAAPKPWRLVANRWAQVACLSLTPGLLFAETPARYLNLAACMSGRPSCQRSRLTLTEMGEVAAARLARNVASCSTGASCDHTKLNKAEEAAVAVALSQRNVSNCTTGIGSCDHARLTQSEAGEVATAGRKRELLEGARNYSACLNRRDDCDRSRLTPSETAAIPPEAH
jgi:hypothetical protein